MTQRFKVKKSFFDSSGLIQPIQQYITLETERKLHRYLTIDGYLVSKPIKKRALTPIKNKNKLIEDTFFASHTSLTKASCLSFVFWISSNNRSRSRLKPSTISSTLWSLIVMFGIVERVPWSGKVLLHISNFCWIKCFRLKTWSHKTFVYVLTYSTATKAIFNVVANSMAEENSDKLKRVCILKYVV